MPPPRYENHTDSVPEKIRLFQDAYAAGQFDLALSMCDSIKGTLSYERPTLSATGEPHVTADLSQPLAKLPAAWAGWARGWNYFHKIDVFETVGIERLHEPVEFTLAVPADQIRDPYRELRVAGINPRDGALHEVPSQVVDTLRRGGERLCRILFLAEVGPHERSTYLVFFGNEHAELPGYPSNLKTAGEACGLDISNQHFTARLSPQSGQLERIIYTRQHGLELYAGGKGHGEPPQIDWGHDYVDEGHFQKLRIRNWASCRNYEVLQGPLCVRIRRWGFPHSPLHPLYTPSRVHMDVTYSFFAGLPYFFKQSRFDVVKDTRIEAMRDDEWVFSGYSFDRQVWIDAAGRLHEGSVPAQHAENLWGVGFYHGDSRDAFIALRLDHSAENFSALGHGGVPTLHYDGHGQLWSRYPAETTFLKKGTSIKQNNAYVLSPYPREDAAGEIERLRHQLMNPLLVEPSRAGDVRSAMARGRLAREGETAESAGLKPAVWNALGEVKDEQLYTVDTNIVDMGYIYDVRQRGDVIQVLLTMPHRGRPVFQFLVTQGGGRVEEGIRERLLRLNGVRDVVVELTWDPDWSIDRLTDAARESLGLPAF